MEAHFHIFYCGAQVYGLNFASSLEAKHFVKQINLIFSKRLKQKHESSNLAAQSHSATHQILNESENTELKLEISAPTNFRHLHHIAWNPVIGKFEITSPNINDSINEVIRVKNAHLFRSFNNHHRHHHVQKHVPCFQPEANPLYDEAPPLKPPRVPRQDETPLDYENERFTLYCGEEIEAVFNRSFVHKFGAMPRMLVKNVNLPPPPPLPSSL